MECPECFNPWNSDNCIPRLLKCGHSLCQDCVACLLQQNSVECPACHDLHLFSIGRRSGEASKDFGQRCVESLTKNYTLLSLISTRPSLSVDKSKAMRVFKLGMLCPEHNKPIHSFTEMPFSMLCDECLIEISEFGLNAQPFNEAVLHSKQNLIRASEQIRTKLSRLHGVRTQLEGLAGGENQFQLKSLELHLQGFKDRLDIEHRDSLENLAQLYSSLSHIQGKIDHEINIQQEAVLKIDNKARQLAECDDFTLIMRHVEVTQLLELSRKQLPHIEVPNAMLQVTLNPVPYDTVKQVISSSVQLTLEAEQDDSWKCKDCPANVENGTVMCPGCKSFRPLESYKSLIVNPMNASTQEIRELEQRRELELAMISALDNTGEAEQTLWYIINADWVSEWKCFIFNKPSHVREQNSINQDIGVLPPGPISNNRLFKDPLDPVELRLKLKPVAHYRGVNEQVWKAYAQMYGGGPVICRKRLNIYEGLDFVLDRATF